MSEQDLIVRLARSCARGPRQLSFVNELLIDEGYQELVPIPTVWEYTSVYGDSRLSGSSYQGLKKRLIAVGFIIKREGEYPKPGEKRRVHMRFSV